MESLFVVGLEETISRGAGVVAFFLFESKKWEAYQIVLWTVVILLALEVLSQLVLALRPFFSAIPAKGKHLDQLTPTDLAFVWFNRLCTPLFTFHVLLFLWKSSHVVWQLSGATFLNTVGATALTFIIYDFFYTLFHRALHARGLYKYIHKHHHRQKVPTRGNIDAVNVHPIEFIIGEYNHLFALYLTSRLIDIHALSGMSLWRSLSVSYSLF